MPWINVYQHHTALFLPVFMVTTSESLDAEGSYPPRKNGRWSWLNTSTNFEGRYPKNDFIAPSENLAKKMSAQEHRTILSAVKFCSCWLRTQCNMLVPLPGVSPPIDSHLMGKMMIDHWRPNISQPYKMRINTTNYQFFGSFGRVGHTLKFLLCSFIFYVPSSMKCSVFSLNLQGLKCLFWK